MTGLDHDDIVLRDHGQLVHRASAIFAASAGSRGDAGCTLTASDADQPAGRGRVVALERNDAPFIERVAGNRLKLGYADGGSEASLAALLACVTKAGDPIAADPESLAVLSLAERLAVSDIPVLINGPTGTGKEVLARFIHSRSARADKPFVAVNCAAVPEAMLEALLFGHQKGAFTGAHNAGEGFFRAADGGTLLLDEIAEMPLALQAKLLRALQEGEVVPLGATRPIKIDVRIIACANRDLPLEVEEGRFRADLFYRLNVFPLSLRPLCERPEDVAPLAFALALRHAPAGAPLPWIANDALNALKAHNWPGNIRELENVMRRALLLSNGDGEIGLRHIHFDRPARLVTTNVAIQPAQPVEIAAPVAEPAGGEALSKVVQLSEARAIMATLEACDGSRVRAAKRLGISERTLRYRLARFRDAGQMIAGGTA
ncbi:MAG: sigma-54 interaction domain-containing protein [Sphingobium sp.]